MSVRTNVAESLGRVELGQVELLRRSVGVEGRLVVLEGLLAAEVLRGDVLAGEVVRLSGLLDECLAGLDAVRQADG